MKTLLITLLMFAVAAAANAAHYGYRPVCDEPGIEASYFEDEYHEEDGGPGTMSILAKYIPTTGDFGKGVNNAWDVGQKFKATRTGRVKSVLFALMWNGDDDCTITSHIYSVGSDGFPETWLGSSAAKLVENLPRDPYYKRVRTTFSNGPYLYSGQSYYIVWTAQNSAFIVGRAADGYSDGLMVVDDGWGWDEWEHRDLAFGVLD